MYFHPEIYFVLYFGPTYINILHYKCNFVLNRQVKCIGFEPCEKYMKPKKNGETFSQPKGNLICYMEHCWYNFVNKK